MARNHEALLVATLVGLIIVSAAAFAVQPTPIGGQVSTSVAPVAQLSTYDQLGLPAPHAPRPALKS